MRRSLRAFAMLRPLHNCSVTNACHDKGLSALPTNTVSGINTRSVSSQCPRRIILTGWTLQRHRPRKGVQLAPEAQELLPKARVPILLSGDSLPDSSCRPGLYHCVSTVLCRSLEARLREFVLVCTRSAAMATFFQSVYVNSPNSSLKRSLELVLFCLAYLTAGNLRQHSAEAYLAGACSSALFNVIFVSIKATLADPNVSISRRQGFGRANTKSTQNLKAAMNGSPAPSPTSSVPDMPTLLNSPSVSSILSYENTYGEGSNKKFFNEKYAKCSVKGNFLTLAAQPKNVELGEWLAHQRE